MLHDLLYIGEHQTCNHYRADVGSGFIYEELEAGETERLDTVRRNHLLILLEGRCSLDCNQFSGRDFSAGEMILVPRSAAFSASTSSSRCRYSFVSAMPIKMSENAME